MTRLFVRFYAAIVIVLLAAWYIHGAVSDSLTGEEFSRVVEAAHQGGVLSVVAELSELAPNERPAAMQSIRSEFAVPVWLQPTAEVPQYAKDRHASGTAVVFYASPEGDGYVTAPLADGLQWVGFGPLPRYTHYEAALSGGVLRATSAIKAAPQGERTRVLQRLTSQFGYPVRRVSRDSLPQRDQWRLQNGERVVFFATDGQSYIAAPLDDLAAARFGPFPSYDGVNQRILTMTLFVVLLLAAVAIALLLRPVAKQLGVIENAAQSIADGDLSARVDETQTGSAQQLASTFNHMAGRLETVLGTQRELLQAVSHELRTPLSRIRFAIDLIRDTDNDQDRNKRLEALDAASDDLNELLEELLDYVRLEGADQQRERDSISFRQSCNALFARHAPMFPEIEFAIGDLSGDVAEDDIIIHANRSGWHRALDNVVGNAGRFARSRVTVSATAGNGHVTVDVSDDGPGIPENDRERIFEPFTRLDNQTGQSGVGLGLAIVRRIVSHHGGAITVSASESGGCRMQTSWPATDNDQAR
ncbi:MAG: ATP-binding protein [Planctomycetota bacterium]|nr:ATP-binding protein [Planctomycetota bacterium]